MKKVLVSGYIGFNNFGDEAIFYALSQHLKKIEADVRALSSNPLETEKKYGVFTYYFKNPKDILRAILSCDILISGGGSLLQNKTSNISLLYYLFIIIIAKLLNKKVMIFSQGIEKIKGDFFEKLTAFVLKKVDYISVRDKNSSEYLKTLKIDSFLTSDPVYSIAQNVKKNENKSGMVIQLRAYKGLEERLIKELAQIVSKLEENDIKILSLQDEIDKNVCEKFQKTLKKTGKNAQLISNKTISETIEIINSAKYVISMRFHGALLAHALGCKTFSLCYDDKIKNLSDELEIEKIDLYNYSTNELDEKLNRFYLFNHTAKQYRVYDWSSFDSWIKNN